MEKRSSWRGLNEFIQNGLVRTKGEIEDKPGVYIVRWGSRDQPLSRLLGEDDKKIMYIGHSNNLKRRIGSDFIRPYYNKTTGPHAGIITLYYTGLMEKIDLEELEVIWKYYESKKMAKTQEFYSLKSYVDVYGELPPVNRQGARSKEPDKKLTDSIDESLENLIK